MLSLDKWVNLLRNADICFDGLYRKQKSIHRLSASNGELHDQKEKKRERAYMHRQAIFISPFLKTFFFLYDENSRKEETSIDMQSFIKVALYTYKFMMSPWQKNDIIVRQVGEFASSRLQDYNEYR